MTQKLLLGLLMISKKKIQPLFSSFCLTKKNKYRYHVENVKKSQFSCLNHLFLRAHMCFQSPMTFGPLLTLSMQNLTLSSRKS